MCFLWKANPLILQDVRLAYLPTTSNASEDGLLQSLLWSFNSFVCVCLQYVLQLVCFDSYSEIFMFNKCIVYNLRHKVIERFLKLVV
jgi:hypothetical protein